MRKKLPGYWFPRSVRWPGWRWAMLFIGLASAGLGCNIEKPYLLEPQVYASPTQFFVAPSPGLFTANRVGLFYFITPVNFPNVSYPLTKIFYQQFLKNQIFCELELIPETYSTLAEALSVGRSKRYDLILLGQIPYFLDSGTTSKSGLQVDLRVLEVNSGATVCYLSDAIGAEPSPMRDFVVWDTKPKPSPSIYALAQILSDRISRSLIPYRFPDKASQELNQVRQVPAPPNPFGDTGTK
jgi:hypothetical protein